MLLYVVLCLVSRLKFHFTFTFLIANFAFVLNAFANMLCRVCFGFQKGNLTPFLLPQNTIRSLPCLILI